MAAGTAQGYDQALVFSENQKQDWCNMFALSVEPPCIRNPARLRSLFKGNVEDRGSSSEDELLSAIEYNIIKL
ncbi:hypothetical protein J1N35_016397 [Gossypium stocksii]|uniref:Uncharacterized protein n=1 Tax=Gossypium stocksii TaxID=47602 RepID=A0A9D4A552_9ROSI|nr:hypothetical protein J1N35_016397 [Gossypium stocksii]